jgi:outer membrane protein
VEQAYLNASNAMQSYEAANLQLQAAAESYRITNEQFKLGAINIYDLLQQRNQYVQAVQAFTQAKYTAVLQQKIYEFYMGNPVTL